MHPRPVLPLQRMVSVTTTVRWPESVSPARYSFLSSEMKTSPRTPISPPNRSMDGAIVLRVMASMLAVLTPRAALLLRWRSASAGLSHRD